MPDLSQSGGRSTPGKDEGIRGVPQPSSPPLGQNEATDLCSDCGRVLPPSDLFRCGRRRGDGWLVIQLCIDCLYAVNPYMQRDLIEAAYA